jgi:hypothetical protein
MSDEEIAAKSEHGRQVAAKIAEHMLRTGEISSAEAGLIGQHILAEQLKDMRPN